MYYAVGAGRADTDIAGGRTAGGRRGGPVRLVCRRLVRRSGVGGRQVGSRGPTAGRRVPPAVWPAAADRAGSTSPTVTAAARPSPTVMAGPVSGCPAARGGTADTVNRTAVLSQPQLTPFMPSSLFFFIFNTSFPSHAVALVVRRESPTGVGACVMRSVLVPVLFSAPADAVVHGGPLLSTADPAHSNSSNSYIYGQKYK